MLSGKPIFQGDVSRLGQLKSIFGVLSTASDPDLDGILRSFKKDTIVLTSDMLEDFSCYDKYAPFDLSEAISEVLDCLGPWGLDLLSRMLNVNPKARISIEQAIKHQYFSALEEGDSEVKLIRKFSFAVAADKNRITILNVACGLTCLDCLPAHENIISMDWFDEDGGSGFNVISKYKSTRTLRAYLCTRPSVETTHDIMWQLLKGIAHCHAYNVVHNDIRPENVCVKYATHSVQICGFDLAFTLECPSDIIMSRPKVFVYYQGPEQLSGDMTYSCFASDIWSAGCIFAEMLMGKKVSFTGNSKSEQRDAIIKFQDFPPHAISLLSGRLTLDPACRYSAAQCLENAFFSPD